MTEEALHKELLTARQQQADAEYSRELAGLIVENVASAVKVYRWMIYAACPNISENRWSWWG